VVEKQHPTNEKEESTDNAPRCCLTYLSNTRKWQWRTEKADDWSLLISNVFMYLSARSIMYTFTHISEIFETNFQPLSLVCDFMLRKEEIRLQADGASEHFAHETIFFRFSMSGFAIIYHEKTIYGCVILIRFHST
jgi:hypothetical protein